MGISVGYSRTKREVVQMGIRELIERMQADAEQLAELARVMDETRAALGVK